jgi:hypothetical protein
MYAFEAGDRRRPLALNFCRGSAPWQRLVQSGFYEVALKLLFRGAVVPRDLTEPSRLNEAAVAALKLLRQWECKRHPRRWPARLE